MKRTILGCLFLSFSLGFASVDFAVIEVEPLSFVETVEQNAGNAQTQATPAAAASPRQTSPQNERANAHAPASSNEEIVIPRGRRAQREALFRSVLQAQKTADLALAQISELKKIVSAFEQSQQIVETRQRRMSAALLSVSPTRLEENEIQLAYLTEAFQDLYSRVGAIQILPIIQQTLRTPVRPAGFTVSDATRKLGGDEFAIFSRGLSAFRRTFFEESRQILRHTIQTFPQGDFTDRANFWIAEAYFRERNYSAALVYYQKVLDFIGSSKEDDAQHRIAVSYQNMGELDIALSEFMRLIHRYPSSEFVIPANEAIQEIRTIRNRQALQQSAAPIN